MNTSMENEASFRLNNIRVDVRVEDGAIIVYTPDGRLFIRPDGAVNKVRIEALRTDERLLAHSKLHSFTRRIW